MGPPTAPAGGGPGGPWQPGWEPPVDKVKVRMVGRTILLVGLSLAAVLILLGIILAIQERSNLIPHDKIKAGDCFKDPGDADLRGVERQDCSGKHDYEVFAVAVHPAAKGAPFPGREALIQFAAAQCLGAFQTYVGAPFQDTAYADFELLPIQKGWEKDDLRRVVCAAGREDGQKLTGSIKGRGTAPPT